MSISGQISRAISDLYAAAAFSSDGRDVSDYAAAMKMHSYKAGLNYRAVGKNPPSRYAEALNLCLEAAGGTYDPVRCREPELDRVMLWEPDVEVVSAELDTNEAGETIIRCVIETDLE